MQNHSGDWLSYIRGTLRAKEDQTPPKYIIVDGFDNLPWVFQCQIGEEIRNLGPGMKVMLTRRVPSFQSYIEYTLECNECEQELPEYFWQCKICQDTFSNISKHEGDGFEICYSCKNRDIRCDKPGHGEGLIEPYEHLDIPVRNPPEDKLVEFVERTFRREYPESVSKEQISRDAAHAVVVSSDCNLANTKLRLDHARELPARNEAFRASDRLPRTIVAFYDAEIDRIEGSTRHERDLVLVALCAVAEREMIQIDIFERYLKHFSDNILTHEEDTYTLVKLVLRLARGLIWKTRECIGAHHRDFLLYGRESYNRDLVRASQLMKVMEAANTEIVGLFSPKYRFPDEAPAAPNDYLFRMGAIEEEPLRGPVMSPLVLSPPLTSSPTTSTQISSPSLFRQISTDSGYYSSSSPALVQESTRDNTKSRRGDHKDPSQSEKRGLGITMDNQTSQNIRSVCCFCQDTTFQCGELKGHVKRELLLVKVSAEASCPFCSFVFKIGSSSPEALIRSHEYSEYDWSLRFAGRTSNDYEICTVTIQLEKQPRQVQTSSPEIITKNFTVICDEDLGNRPHDFQVGQSTHPDYTGPQIKSWINTCDTQHPFCQYNNANSFVPTRLVDINTGNQEMIRVVETKKHNIKGPYVTLSHCWGRDYFMRLQRDNEKILMGPGVRTKELTKNFQQAIEVARFIGVRYIWIDSLCIVQGQGGDFAYEGNFMHKVYRSSYCNIVAADSRDSKGGLFRDRKPDDIAPATFMASENSVLEDGMWRVLEEDMWKSELLEADIYKRGWVFQERMLSPRILHFTKSQIYWDCSTISACEVLPDGLPFSLDRFASTDRHWRGRLQETADVSQDAIKAGPNDLSLETFWRNALLRYTQCDLTNQGDKTIAIWSVAKLVRDLFDLESTHEQYGGGVWGIALHEQLAWHALDCVGHARLENLQHANPSWSWASVKGPMIAQDRLTERCYVVQSHSEEDISFRINDQQGNRDKEPQLVEPFSIEMNGYFGNGFLVEGHNEEYGFLVDLKDDPPIFQVHLDEKPTPETLGSETYQFIILAASSSGSPTTDDSDSGGNANEDDEFSGTGLVLIKHEVYQYKQRALLKTLLSQLRSMQSNTSSEVREALVERILNLQQWRSKLTKREKLHEAGPHYRRIGAFHFYSVPADVWSNIEGMGRSKFWLD
ncbi:HET-domain-containing protein [Corynespora cassiicola Philippines]|uniref:HET-domain-containing protein n=1 Tax=Corynespora cassiicola Philippines TaxID=1448308 RepID=A0A2T2P3J1_CORCC|nr:HET-domain-containing protein [Corynespora cassiicola Philippines]